MKYSIELIKYVRVHLVVELLKVKLEFKNVDGAMHFIYSHKYNTNSAEDSSDMN